MTRALLLAVFALLALGAHAQEPEAAGRPRLKIESFAPARAYVTGQNSVTLMASVRNVGNAPLAEGTVSGRLSCVSGLEYTEGDTLPKVPALAPNAVVTYRWRVTPTSTSGALVAAFALEYPDGLPDISVLGIQRFPAEPLEGVPSALPSAIARVQGGRSILENGKIRARIESTESNVPALWLSVRTPGGWRRAGVSIPIAEVLSGEGGQEPWWEVFRAESARAVNGIQEASLILVGGAGIRWRATIVLTLRTGSSVLDCDIRLAPLRPIKISGVRLATLLAGDNSFGSQISEELPYSINGPNAVAAVRASDMVVGSSWPTTPIYRDWQIRPSQGVPGADYTVIGTECVSSGAPVELKPGGLVDFRCRLYALNPSTNVRDAFNIIVPAVRSVARPAPMSRVLASRRASLKMSTSQRALILRKQSGSRKTTSAGSKRSNKAKLSRASKKRSGRATGRRSRR